MNKQDLTTGFQQVDSAQHQFLIKFLEDVAIMPPVVEGFKVQLERLDIRNGDRVLDVGCGIGLQARAMAELVGAKGKVVGTDLSAVMVEIAKARTASSGLPLEFLLADAVSQPFDDQSFDRIRTERVLMYIRDTAAVLGEFKRLLTQGGRLVVFDFDWDATVIAHADKALTRKIVRYAADSFPNGRIGGELFLQLKRAGFEDVRVTPSSYSGNDETTLGITKRIYEGIIETGISNNLFTQEEIAAWWGALEKDTDAGNLFVSYQGFIASGTKV